MMRVSIDQKNIIIENIYATSNSAPKHMKQKLTEPKKK